ncbi:MAG: Lrp/AsnC family transcriptional regulator [Gammaproteobacteria bacterium]|nr:Lrp/AsnC family transcriptional regulator [Gammaproteobacteria bacterium]
MVDALDRQLIVLTQAGLPLLKNPYALIATKLGISEGEVLQRMQSMLERGVIRRIGAVPNHYKLGYRANGMSVWDVADDRLDQLGRAIGQLSFVSHCYQRPRQLPIWPYNLFAMVHAHTREEAMAYVAQIQALLGDACRGHDVLFSSRILKKTGLRLQKTTLPGN